MGWNISHGPGADDIRRSYTSMHNLLQHLAHVLPGADWRRIKELFNRGSGDPFTVTPNDAGEMARVLRAAADHPKMPTDWADEALSLASSAEHAANSRQPWEWR
jgi:hypothetical protein